MVSLRLRGLRLRMAEASLLHGRGGDEGLLGGEAGHLDH